MQKKMKRRRLAALEEWGGPSALPAFARESFGAAEGLLRDAGRRTCMGMRGYRTLKGGLHRCAAIV